MMDRKVSTKFSTMYLVSNKYVEDCEAQKRLLTQETAILDHASRLNDPTQSVRDPTTDNPPPPPATNLAAPNANLNPVNNNNPAFVCENILRNNRVCGQQFDNGEELFAHQLNAHSAPKNNGPVSSTPRNNVTMADTIISASLQADRNAESDPIVNASDLKCAMCPFIATTTSQLERHLEQIHMNEPVNAHVLTGSNAGGGNELKDLVESYRNDDEEVPSNDTSTPNIRRRLRGGDTKLSRHIAAVEAERKAKKERMEQNKIKRKREKDLREAMRRGLEDQENMSGVEEGTDPTPSVSKRKSIQAKVATRAIKSSVNPSKKFIVARKKRTVAQKKRNYYRKKVKAAMAKKSRPRPHSTIGTYKQQSKLAAAEARIANLKKKIRNKRKRLLKKQSKNENYHALGLEGYE